MATLWDVITGNSSLPVQAGNTFWDHLNNQVGGGGGGLGGRADLEIKSTNEVLATSSNNESITINANSESLTLKADKKGLTV